MSDKEGNTKVNESNVYQEFIVGNSDCKPTALENLVNVKTLERFFDEKIDREMSNIVDTDKHSIQNAILTVIDSNIINKIDSPIRLINASSGRNATSVMVSSERGEHIGNSASSENVSESNNTIHVFSLVQMMRLEIMFRTR